jgi:hypothetical protein
MSGFIQGEDRFQATLFPERLDDYVAEDSAVRVIDVFLDDLDLSGLEKTFHWSVYVIMEYLYFVGNVFSWPLADLPVIEIHTW